MGLRERRGEEENLGMPLIPELSLPCGVVFFGEAERLQELEASVTPLDGLEE